MVRLIVVTALGMAALLFGRDAEALQARRLPLTTRIGGMRLTLLEVSRGTSWGPLGPTNVSFLRLNEGVDVASQTLAFSASLGLAFATRAAFAEHLLVDGPGGTHLAAPTGEQLIVVRHHATGGDSAGTLGSVWLEDRGGAHHAFYASRLGPEIRGVRHREDVFLVPATTAVRAIHLPRQSADSLPVSPQAARYVRVALTGVRVLQRATVRLAPAATVAAPPAAKPPLPQQAWRFTVTGTLLAADGTSLAADTLRVFPMYNGSVVSVSSGSGGVLSSREPRGVTDSLGRFEIEVDSSYISLVISITGADAAAQLFVVGRSRFESLGSGDRPTTAFSLGTARREGNRIEVGQLRRRS